MPITSMPAGRGLVPLSDVADSKRCDGPPELVLGTVATVEKSERGLFQEATITPAVDASRLDEVFIVVGAK